MSDHKPFLVLWSKAAVRAAGPNISTLQAKLLEEVTEIVSEAHDWFLHALPGEGEHACYPCTGNELPGSWKIFVQIAQYKPMRPIPDDHPDPERRGKVFRFPEALKEPDNEIFASYEDVITL